MFIKTERRKGKGGSRYNYYRLMESFRDEYGAVEKRPVLGLGRLDGFSGMDLADFVVFLNRRLRGESSTLHPELHSAVVLDKVEDVYSQLIAQGKADVVGTPKSGGTLEQYRQSVARRFIVKSSSLKHEKVREIGAANLCLGMARRLKLDKVLRECGLDDWQVRLAMTQIAARAAHPASELATLEWLRERSELCRLTGLDAGELTKDHLYQGSIRLYDNRERLMRHLSTWTKELFSYDDSIILYDLTNTYMEGVMAGSKVCRRGRSKEKRSDCKLIVLALVVNRDGFPKYYKFFEGNMSDPESLRIIIDDLDAHMRTLGVIPTIVMDAGIATDENLAMLRRRGYKYLCVSRSSSKAYSPIEGEQKVCVEDNRHQPIELQRVSVEGADESESFYWVRSEMKAAKEQGMRDQFNSRFEAELEKIRASLTKPRGVKKADKVSERIGRAKQKYPSVASHYDITKTVDEETGNVTSLEWKLKPEHESYDSAGVYFLQTNLDGKAAETIWTIYNILKNVESSFRCLKTDLDMRPVYHKSDTGCLAHLHLAVLAYWVVVSIRHMLASKGIHQEWRFIVETMDSQQSVHSTMENLDGETVVTELCSEPEEKVAEIYQCTKIDSLPYKPVRYIIRKKDVGTQVEDSKNKGPANQGVEDG